MKTYRRCAAALAAVMIAPAACGGDPPSDDEISWNVSPANATANVGESIPFEVTSIHSASITAESHRVLVDVVSSDDAVIDSFLDVELELDGGLIVRTCKSAGDANLTFNFSAYPDGSGNPLTQMAQAKVTCLDGGGSGGSGGSGGAGGGGAGGAGGASPCDPEVEPNDEPMQADDLGAIASGQSACVGLTSEDFDVDYATFDVAAGTTVAAVIDGCMPADSSYELHLYDANDNLLNYTNTACPVVLQSPGPLDAGSYVLRVYGGVADASSSYLYVQAL